MATRMLHGSVRRFGPRYGKRVKDRVGKIETLKRESTMCPYCRKEKAERLSAGIWHCRKCKAKFAGGAYTISALKLKETEGVEEAPKEGKKEKKKSKAQEVDE